jgi:hypothetical protein
MMRSFLAGMPWRGRSEHSIVTGFAGLEIACLASPDGRRFADACARCSSILRSSDARLFVAHHAGSRDRAEEYEPPATVPAATRAQP